MDRKVIGIIGGVGPYAGLDLNRKIFDNTKAGTDQEHAKVVLISMSEIIPDRTAYIKQPETNDNPAIFLARIAEILERSGAEVVGIPCNTAHSPQIIDEFNRINRKNKLRIEFINMIEETFKYIRKMRPLISRVGLMCTLGTYQSGLYNEEAKKNDIDLIIPESDKCNEIHDAIYNREYGIKAFSNPVTDKAVLVMESNADILTKNGAMAVILGCTEIPLAVSQKSSKNIYIDPADILAKSLLEKAGYPLKNS